MPRVRPPLQHAPLPLLPWRGRPRAYLSDPHWDHVGILSHCARPFADVAAMNLAILGALREAEAAGYELILGGDLANDFARFVARYGWLAFPERHVCVAGNHDRPRKHAAAYAAAFGLVVGDERTWTSNALLVEDEIDGRRVVVCVSHDPLRWWPGAPATYNVHGHVHDDIVASPGAHDLTKLAWLLNSARHLNASVEMIGYRPQTLAALVAAQGTPLRRRIPDLRAVRPDPRRDAGGRPAPARGR